VEIHPPFNRVVTRYGGTFTRKNITLLKNVPHTVNKRAYLRNIKNRLANTALNNLNTTVIKIKNALPQNVSWNEEFHSPKGR